MTSDWEGLKFVTEEVVKAFKKAKVKGRSFTPLSQVELPFDPVK